MLRKRLFPRTLFYLLLRGCGYKQLQNVFVVPQSAAAETAWEAIRGAKLLSAAVAEEVGDSALLPPGRGLLQLSAWRFRRPQVLLLLLLHVFSEAGDNCLRV
jgi:hypothetical protein